MRSKTCDICGEPVEWIQSPKGKWAPMEIKLTTVIDKETGGTKLERINHFRRHSRKNELFNLEVKNGK
jgi:hypothetical protein